MADAVEECCISLLRQDKARQAKTGLSASQPPLDPPQEVRATQNWDLPYRRRVPRGLLVDIERTVSKKRERRECEVGENGKNRRGL